MALLHLAARWRDAAARRCPRCIAATVDHGLRPEAAEEGRDGGGDGAGRCGVPHAVLRWTGPKPAPVSRTPPGRRATRCSRSTPTPSARAISDRPPCRRPGRDRADAPAARQRARRASRAWRRGALRRRRASMSGRSWHPEGRLVTPLRGGRACLLRRSLQRRSALRAGAPARRHAGAGRRGPDARAPRDSPGAPHGPTPRSTRWPRCRSRAGSASKAGDGRALRSRRCSANRRRSCCASCRVRAGRERRRPRLERVERLAAALSRPLQPRRRPCAGPSPGVDRDRSTALVRSRSRAKAQAARSRGLTRCERSVIDAETIVIVGSMPVVGAQWHDLPVARSPAFPWQTGCADLD